MISTTFKMRPLAAMLGLTLTSGLTLIACGGGGTQVTDISGSGVVSGPIDNFGSIIANGVRMDIAGAQISDDGQILQQSDLDVGDTVIMRGTLNGDGTGRAASVITDEFLKGPVESVDIPGNRFIAMGQTVLVDLATAFSGVTLETLSNGMLVEVHGSLDADDRVRATRVELKTAVSEYELTGVIDTITPTTFEVNDMIVNYGAATVDTQGDVPLRTGMLVDIKATAAPSGGVLTAVEVEEEGRLSGAAPGDEAEIEGLITQVLSTTRFVLDGLIVAHDASTRFERGSAAGLVVNARVEVEGRVDANGVLQAETIELEDEIDVSVATTVDAIDPAAGTITVLGKVFRTDISTQFEDERDELEPFRLSDLSVGDYVEVSAYRDGNVLTASRIERDEDDTRLELRGPIDSDNGSNTLTILGVVVTTDSGTQFRNENDIGIPAATFYGTVGPGDVVEIRQDVAGGPIVADEVEIEELVP